MTRYGLQIQLPVNDELAEKVQLMLVGIGQGEIELMSAGATGFQQVRIWAGPPTELVAGDAFWREWIDATQAVMLKLGFMCTFIVHRDDKSLLNCPVCGEPSPALSNRSEGLARCSQGHTFYVVKAIVIR